MKHVHGEDCGCQWCGYCGRYAKLVDEEGRCSLCFSQEMTRRAKDFVKTWKLREPRMEGNEGVKCPKCGGGGTYLMLPPSVGVVGKFRVSNGNGWVTGDLYCEKCGEISVEDMKHSRGGIKSIARCESPIEKRLHDAMAKAGIVFVNQWPAGEYRLDFANRHFKVAVETDGHDFHEKTKEQAQRDKSRDRYLAAQGWTVLRFTGSEVHRDAKKCAEEVRSVLISKGDRSFGL